MNYKILAYESWLNESKTEKPEGQHEFDNVRITWCDFNKAKKMTKAKHDDENMDPSTFLKTFDNDHTFEGAEFCVMTVYDKELKEDHVAAIALVGKRDDMYGELEKDVKRWPDCEFIYELGAVQYDSGKKDSKGKPVMQSVYRGSGSRVMEEVMKKKGTKFWLRCLDYNADAYWKYFAKKNSMKIEVIGKTGDKGDKNRENIYLLTK